MLEDDSVQFCTLCNEILFSDEALDQHVKNKHKKNSSSSDRVRVEDSLSHFSGLWSNHQVSQTSGALADLFLVPDCSPPVPVHLAVLLHLSPHLRQLVQHAMVWGEHPQLLLPDFSVATVRGLVSLLYWGFCDVDGSTSEEIVSLAASIGIPLLRDRLQIVSEDDHCEEGNVVIDLDNVLSPTTEDTYVCRYPDIDNSDSVSVHVNDFETLAPGIFINDVIVDFYIKYILHEKLVSKDQDQVIVFSAMFFTKLSEREDFSPKDQRLARMQKWTKGVNLFDKSLVVIPVCKDSHWFLVVAVSPGQNDGFIMLLDSLQRPQERAVTLVQEFFEFEWRRKRSAHTEDYDEFPDMEVIHPDKPNQTHDLTECGAFLMCYCDWLFENLKMIRLKAIPKEWFTNEILVEKREVVKNILLNLSARQKLKSLILQNVCEGISVTRSLPKFHRLCQQE